MAAEVPAKDVLCEAMEYLTKLGSNLRTRSENLRQKKISREKLNNALAVQKAAGKVLLICELSKKSLENVENGVRQVLKLVDMSQASTIDGGKNKETRKNEAPDDCKQFYIKYKSRKLRMRNRISFKHYNSVRVYATSLPQSTIDKYPVYHDCKLYRMRKKLELHQKHKARNKSDTADRDSSIISIPETPDCKSTADRNEDINTKNMSVISIPDSPESNSDKNTVVDEDADIVDSSKCAKVTSENVRPDNNACKAKETSDKGQGKRPEKETAISSKDTISEIESSDDDKGNNRKKSFKRKRVTSNSSLSERNNETHIHSDQERCRESDAKKIKLKKSSNDAPNSEKSNDSTVSESKPLIKCISLDKLLKPSVVKSNKSLSKPKVDQSEKQKTLESDKKEKAEQNKCKELESIRIEEEKYWTQKRKEVAMFKPKKFVVNIERMPEFSSSYLKKIYVQKITRAGITICKINDKVEVQNDNENHTESISRRNSSQSFDDSALIDEANKVKNSLLNESESEIEMNSDVEITSSKNETVVLKNQLLNDSDSDSKKSDEESNKIKKRIEAGSDEREVVNSPLSEEDEGTRDSGNKQEKDKVGREHDKESCNIEPQHDENSCDVTSREQVSSNDENKEDQDNVSDLNEPVQLDEENLTESQKNDNEKTPEKTPPGEDGDVAKSSLLQDSSEEKTKTPQEQTLTPQTKKQQSNAKKMLLNHSSSEAEDEKLSDAVTDIKKSLLHSSDDETKTPEKKKEASQSSSEEDIVRKVKMKKKEDKVKRHKHKKQRRRLDSEDSSDSDTSKSRKMVRSKSKPGNSSCQNSDAPDTSDKDIDGLTNLKTLNKARRRESNSSEMEEDSSVTNSRSSRRRKTKLTGLISGEILKAESSEESAAGSADENVAEDEDMPIMPVAAFNGADHLEKEDLLGESDSSASHNDDDKTGVKEESDEEEKLNSKRRKAIAISSDSEVGSSRKKEADAGDKLSDFEDSEDSDVANKRSKRKKKAVESDASVGSTSSTEGGKKKRRRIKSVRDSDVSGSESETEGRNKHGRKNIRKVMGKNQLEEATKKAARQEKERIARIAERQKMYNNMLFDESGKPDEVVLDKVVLDFDPETKEPLIEVDRGLVKKLKPHQANGIKFMWDACFESVKRIKKDRGSGCILAHCMGLGKTLQVVTLTHTLLTHGDLTATNRVLVVCPLSTVLNWVNEFKMWLKYAETEFDVDVYELSRFKQNSERAFQLSQWFRHGGVCVLGYEMFRNLSADNGKKFKKKMLKNFQEALVDPGPDLVVCDEGHLLKNEKTSLSQSMNRVKTYRRIVLTGTPLQNNLKEYYCMVQFVKPNLLGKYNEYLNRFVNPITNGQYTDSTEHDIKIMKRRSHVLHKMLDGAVQRRDYGVLAPFLPPKHEYVLFITLSEVQTKLYQHYLDNFSRRPLPGKSSGFLFPDFQSLQRIWTHPLVLKYNSERYEIMQQKKRDKEEEEDSEGSLRDFIDDDSTSEESMTDDSTDDSSEMSDDSRKKSKKKKKSSKKSKTKDKESKGEGHAARARRATRANPVEVDEEDKDEDLIEVKNENPTEWWIKLVVEDELDDMRNSHKLVLLFDILRQCDAIGDKLLVFSQSLYSLDLIEHFLDKVDNATQEGRIDEKLGGHIGTWSPGVDYFRLDGSTSCENRSIWCKNFNREDNPRARLFLISTRAGGLGINLVAANRVVIFDVSWNPSHDVQSIFRVYRFGQKKPCYVYRFLAMGTMEEKIYERQVTKQAISKRVIDEQQIDRHYAENDLAELYKFEPQPPTPRPIPPLPKDRLFAEMLREHEAQIYKYHEHDSLLENKEEETLSEEERKAAWEDFENEKNKPPPAPFPSTWQMNMLQQQQLAYAALAAMLRKDMPNLSDNQLRDMIPHIYNSNPQLMQKMSEIYKYSPMMAPGMMNPGVMNAGVGAGGMGGGASGLQYEPPWQRQQQQQQQMRLQQLLQQQNPMGAKFYAGGLGSRDPVAMALQHQRAREIMLGGGGGASRPRGRPPMAPRAPPPGDVVNLDSD